MSATQSSTYGRAERMPNTAFRIMSLFLSGREKSAAAALTQFGIRPGDTVVDFGCGPGAYIRSASGLAGAKGRVYAVDIQPLAFKAVERKIKKYRLKNVTPVFADGYPCPLDARTADVVYALDMFHMVTRPSDFLRELHRILKPGGRLVLGDGHQPRAVTKRKISASNLWDIREETAAWLVCTGK